LGEHAKVNRWLTLDFEASRDKLGRLFPIEVGVASLDGKVWSTLICPPQRWARNATAFRPALLKEAKGSGREVADVIAELDGHLSGCPRILSDAIFIDQPLLERLYQEAMPPRTAPHLDDFFAILDELAHQHDWSRLRINEAINIIDNRRGPSHRAGEDARVRAELLRLMLAR
jgi:hypothetical protein